MKILWAASARADIRTISSYISQNNPGNGRKFVRQLISQTDVLVDNPQIGRFVPEYFGSSLREIIYYNYRLMYIIQSEEIVIIAVVESHQNLENKKITIPS